MCQESLLITGKYKKCDPDVELSLFLIKKSPLGFKQDQMLALNTVYISYIKSAPGDG